MIFSRKNKPQKVVITNDNQNEKFQRYTKSKINPKTAQDFLPWDEVYENGVFRCENTFSIMFKWENVNYKTKRESERDKAYQNYINFINGLLPDVAYQEFIVNTRYDKGKLSSAIMPSENNGISEDVYDDFRKIMQSEVDNAVLSGSDSTIIGAISFERKTKLDNVNILFKTFSEFENHAKELGVKLSLMTVPECFELLHSCFHQFNNEPFMIGNNIFQHDINFKDYIAPAQYKFRPKVIEVGSSYSCVMFVKNISKSCDDEFITDMLDNTYSIIVSKHLRKIDQSIAEATLKRNMDDLEGKLERRRMINAKNGGKFIPYALKNREQELERLQSRLNTTNCDLYAFGIYILLSARTEAELNDLILFCKQTATRHHVTIDIMAGSEYQMLGLRTVLPFANPVCVPDGGYIGQTFYYLTDEVSNFIPFSYKNVFSEKGLLYGTNLATKAPIIIDRSENMNANSFVLGFSGSGKSMSIKSELFGARFKYSDDEFIIIDPEQEYAPIAEYLGGEVLKISPSANTYLNIFDTDLSYVEEGQDAVALKSGFILTFMETIIGRPLTAVERTVSDRCVRKVYQTYMMSSDKNDMPTLTEFYEELKHCSEIEAIQLALSLELYVKGSYNIFAHKTNIDYNKSFIIFDISEMGEQLKTVGNLVVLELMWQRVIDNKKRGVRTWVWTDEFSVMFNDRGNSQLFSTGEFFSQVYKRIRKHGGCASGATQNITEVLESPQAKTMLSNSQFTILLSQKDEDMKEIKRLWNLSESQSAYLETGKPGTGLIISGRDIIPFKNLIPKDSLMYKICSTKFSDIQKRIGSNV